MVKLALIPQLVAMVTVNAPRQESDAQPQDALSLPLY